MIYGGGLFVPCTPISRRGVQKDGGNGTMYRPVHVMKRGADVSNIYIYNMHIQNIYTAYIAIMHRQYEYTICIYLSV